VTAHILERKARIVSEKKQAVANTTPVGMGQSIKISVIQTAATWAVRMSLESGYRRVTGRALPTARDREAPFRQVFVWTTLTAAAVAATTVIVDQWVLRPKLPSPPKS
jgi:Protein of unknown function (DUF4235)